MKINYLPNYKHRMIRFNFNNYVQEEDCRENIEKAYLQGKVDERRKFAEWLSRKFGLWTPVGLVNGLPAFTEMNADDVLETYEKEQKGETE